MRLRPFILTLTLTTSGCLDYHFGKDKQGNAGDTSDSGPHLEDTGDVSLEEECNGIDDNNNGLVDEGFSDLDGDGLADCVDTECDVETPGPIAVEVNEECENMALDVLTPWQAEVEWQWNGLSSLSQPLHSTVAPLVAHLTDTDGDNDIDLQDTPNVALMTYADTPNQGTLVVLDGQTGAEVWRKSQVLGWTGHAIADATGDGSPNIALFNLMNQAILLDAQGNLVWTSTDGRGFFLFGQTHIADLDTDGSPEVIAGQNVLDGQTGAVKARLSKSDAVPYTMATIGDIDLDGSQEIVFGNTVFDSSGEVKWSTGHTGSYGLWSVILNADSDPEGEVAMIGGGQFAVYDTDGSTIQATHLDALGVGIPCAADFDGDGDTDIAFAGQLVLYAYDLSGALLWEKPVNDKSGLAGCSAYDLDGDGAHEIVYADEEDLYILDGTTGATRTIYAGHSSGTAFEHPTIADVDRDGTGEILFTSNGNLESMEAVVTVLGHQGAGWTKPTPTWPIQDFAVTNIQPDSTLPSTTPHYWLEDNLYHAQPCIRDISVDLEVAITDVCYAGCMETSEVNISAQVFNTGTADSTGAIPVTLYAVNGSEETVIETQWVTSPIATGWSSASVVFELTYGSVAADGFLVRADDDGAGETFHHECAETNNEATWTDVPC